MLFACILSTQTAYPSLNAAAQVRAQGGGQPVSASTSSMVDPYTGDFHYSVPLLTVPGPNGESVDVSASYHAGIRVDEKASWLGLGWDYNPGEISRQVIGAPDDASEYPVFQRQYIQSTYEYSATSYVGALYAAKINHTPSYASASNGIFDPTYFNHYQKKSMDVYATDRVLSVSERIDMQQTATSAQDADIFKKYSVPYRQMAYDHYVVSGPGLSGQIKPYYFGAMNLACGLNPTQTTTIPSSSPFKKRAQFYFENSARKTITAQSSPEVNSSSNMVKSGVFIKYYKINEINDNSKLFDNSSQKGFLDYKVVSSGSRRSNIDTASIGAYEVTDPNGMTYHYSLAVYAYEECEKVLGPSGVLEYTFKPNKYASSWKLTAVTGPDFQDANNNHVADQGDSGYWISYNYSLWSDAYYWSGAQYGLKDDQYSPSFVVTDGRGFFGWMNDNYVPNGYAKKKSVMSGKSELYYLNNIQTSTHTALFVKSIRQDEQSYDKVASGANPTPMLKLDAIVLLRNEDLGSLYNSANAISGSDLDSRFSYSSCSAAQADPYFMNVTKYNLFKNSLKPKSLKSVALSQDYSLCKKYAFNINTNFTSLVAHNISETVAQQNPMANSTTYPGYTTASYSSSGSNDGKLTLNHIIFQDLMGDKITPGMDFDYAKTDSGKNPDYNADKTDLWGYYKSDWQSNGSHYTSSTSKDYTSAWSLRTITTPLGGQISIEYESDQYGQEGFADDPNLVRNPTNPGFELPGTEPYLIFPIGSMSSASFPPCNQCFGDFVFEDADFSDFYNEYSTTTGIYDLAQLVVPSQRTCMGGTYPYYVVNTVAEIGKSAVPSSGAWSFTQFYPSTVSGSTINYSTGAAVDLDMSGVCTSGYNVAPYNKGFSYGYVLFKAKTLYGGGIRVKNIKTTEPNRGETYTENYTYEDGYCVNVPKKFVTESFASPSYYNLFMNSKIGIEGVSSAIGYKTVTVKEVSLNNTSNGKTVFHFNNDPVSNPILFSYGTTQKTTYCCDQNYTNQSACGTTVSWTRSTGCGSGNHFRSYTNYEFQMHLTYDNKELIRLGQLLGTEVFAENALTPVASTQYTYENKEACTYLGENFNLVKIKDVTPMSDKVYDCMSGTSVVFSSYATCNPEVTYTVYSDYKNRDCFLAMTTTTRDGIMTSEEVMTRDANTGQPLKTRTVDFTRAIFITKTVPTYSNTTYAALGLKSVNESYKNQPTLVENAKTMRLPISSAGLNVDEISDPTSAIMVSEAKNTYTVNYPYRVYNASTSKYENSSQTKNWWRLYKTYTRLLDDVTDYSNTTYNWRQLSEGTLYDTENNKIEETGLNSRKAASKWGYKNRYKLAAIANANYNSFAFSSFEDKLEVASGVYHFGGEVTGGQYQTTYASQVVIPGVHGYPAITMATPHTGSYMAKVPSHTDGPAFNARNFETGRTYIANVWVHSSSPSDARLVMELDGYIDPGGGGSSYAISDHRYIAKSDSKNVTVGSWTLMSLEVIVPEKFDLGATHLLKVYVENNGSSGDAYFDDLAFHPKDAVMTGNVYEERTGLLKAQLDNDNFATLYNYDNAGRVVSTYKEYSGGVKKITENQYHFSKP